MLPPVDDDREPLYVMSPREIVFGVVFGHVETLPPSSSGLSDPRAALEHVVREALLRPPCGVAFSGGRDSSVVLAVAAHVARRDGLAEPIPITKVFPEVPAAEESTWQQSVVRHLRLRDWELVSIDDELDLVGPLATANLVEHGVVWPPMIHGDVPVLERLGGGSLIDGEGGDEVLGIAAHRIAPVTRVLRNPRPVQWRRVRSALGALAPSSVRTRRTERKLNGQPMPWLRQQARAALAEELAELERQAPLSFPASVRLVPRRRAQVLGARNRRYFANHHGVDISSPLLHPDVVAALARRGGVIGPGDRTAVLRSLVPDLLPDTVLSRTSKATFNGAFWGRHTRQFAKRWSGGGVDEKLVDPEVLRSVWISEENQPITAALLQQAWLSDHRR
jgi:asparagine synthase (glutamine-hydrolysing)